MNNKSVEINGIDILKKYKALLVNQDSVQPPVAKTFFQDIPGADGAADLSTAISMRPTYERRQINMNFQCEHREDQWERIFSELLSDFHGKEGKIIFGSDPDYFYKGRMEVGEYERIRTFGKFVITTNAEPYKNELLSSLEPWKWGSFNFKNGIIRSYGNLSVNGTRTLNIYGSERWMVPEFICEGNLTVQFEGKDYDLKPGKSKIYAIVIKPGENVLTFSGTGTVSVNYRGGKL